MLNKGSKKLSEQNIGGILMNAADESTNLYPFYIDYWIFFLSITNLNISYGELKLLPRNKQLYFPQDIRGF